METPIEIREHSFFGNKFKFACDPDHNASYFTFDDEEAIRLRWWHINPGDVILDGGAAFGSYAFPALACGASLIIAWTPEGHKRLFDATAVANGWQDKVIVYDAGLWSKPGFVQVLEHEDPPRFFETLPEKWLAHTPSNVFPVETIDVTVKRHDLKRVDWLKLDVEGAEHEVLKGAEETIRAFKPKILIENHLFKDAQLKNKCANLIFDLDVGYKEIGTEPYHAVSHTLYAP